LPFTGTCAGTGAKIEGRPPAKPGEGISVAVQTVMPGYFRTLRIPIERGRDFNESDNTPTSPYRFIVNQAFVRQFMRGEQPLGKRISVEMDDQNPFGEIVGVTADARESSIDREPGPTVYYVHSHLSYPRMVFLVRAERNPAALTEPVRRIIQQLDPEEPIADARTMEDVLGENFARQRFSAWLLSGFAAAALLLAAIGIYGVLSYSVTARTREFGVRAALGADAGRIVALVLQSGARPVTGGLAIGIAGSLALSGLLKSLLFGIAPRDPATFAAVPLLFALIALIAAVLPARRASRLDPTDALRTE
jgi:putative ABC transport system permease protein